MKKLLLFVGILFATFSATSQTGTVVVPASIGYCTQTQGGVIVQREVRYNGGNSYTFYGTLFSQGNRAIVLTVRCGGPTSEIVFTSACLDFQGEFQIDYTTDCPLNQQYINVGVAPQNQCDVALANASQFGCSEVLPVELASFRAGKSGNTVQLNWQTSMEANSKSFIVQRKTNGDFTDLGTVAAKNIATGTTYNFTDANAANGVAQYRLKIVDLDGSVKYSAIRTIRSGTNVTVSVYPNPSRGNARVTVSENGDPVDVLVIDNSGRVVKRVALTADNSVDLENLKSGTYIIRTTNKINGETTSSKLVVTN